MTEEWPTFPQLFVHGKPASKEMMPPCLTRLTFHLFGSALSASHHPSYPICPARRTKEMMPLCLAYLPSHLFGCSWTPWFPQGMIPSDQRDAPTLSNPPHISSLWFRFFGKPAPIRLREEPKR